MTDKNRLEEIKEIYRWAIENSIANRIADSDIEWLINQAERVQDLKIMLKVLGERNQRYKQALEYIRELAEYDEYENTVEQVYNCTKKALEETE
ncbi:hypothetical protein [Caldifermentibacillus hisashii]|uniref:hypothetical protein n=1 Tax=Caldifermentibacillus hisashii TaxID=996558 RepID=UPI0031B68816